MSFKAQPAQIRASGTTAHGSYLGSFVAKFCCPDGSGTPL